MELTDQKEKQLYKKAKAKAKNIREFYINISLYCLTIPVLIFINLYFTPEFYWFFFPILGWGLGIFFHGMEAFGWSPFLGKNWEERKIRELMQKDQSKNNNL